MNLEFLKQPRSMGDVCMPIQIEKKIFGAIANRDILYLTGKPGIGKTLSVRLISEELGRDLIHINTSLMTQVESLRTLTTSAMSGKSVDGKEAVIFFDECELMKRPSPGHTRKMNSYLKDIENNHTVAVVFASNDDTKILPQIDKMINLKLKIKPPKTEMQIRWLYDMIKKYIPETTDAEIERNLGKTRIRDVAKKSKGDMRHFVASFVDGFDYEPIEFDWYPDIETLARWVFGVADRVKLCQKLEEAFNDKYAKTEYITPKSLLNWLEENFQRVMRKSGTLEQNLRVLNRASKFTNNIEVFCRVISSFIPFRVPKTLRFPTIYKITKKKEEKEKIEQKQERKQTIVKTKIDKTPQGGLTQWLT